jgi:hypothetical protein
MINRHPKEGAMLAGDAMVEILRRFCTLFCFLTTSLVEHADPRQNQLMPNRS